MKRRVVLGSMMAAALPAGAKRPARIAYLSRRWGPNEFEQAFARGMRERGLVEGHHYVVDFRWAAGDTGRLGQLAHEMVATQPDVFVCTDIGATNAVRAAGSSVPIVVPAMGDPLASGYTSSLARPDRDITGISLLVTELSGKRLEHLKEAVPSLQRVGAVFNAVTNPQRATAATKAAGTALGVQVVEMSTSLPDGISSAFAAAVRQGVQGVIIISDTATISHRDALCAEARKHGLPSIFPNSTYARGGALMSYGPDLERSHQRAAYFVDRILKGARVADLPIEQSSQFDLVLNQKIATSLGITFPKSMLLRADHVIQ